MQSGTTFAWINQPLWHHHDTIWKWCNPVLYSHWLVTIDYTKQVHTCKGDTRRFAQDMQKILEKQAELERKQGKRCAENPPWFGRNWRGTGWWSTQGRGGFNQNNQQMSWHKRHAAQGTVHSRLWAQPHLHHCITHTLGPSTSVKPQSYSERSREEVYCKEVKDGDSGEELKWK